MFCEVYDTDSLVEEVSEFIASVEVSNIATRAEQKVRRIC